MLLKYVFFKLASKNINLLLNLMPGLCSLHLECLQEPLLSSVLAVIATKLRVNICFSPPVIKLFRCVNVPCFTQLFQCKVVQSPAVSIKMI